MKILKRVLIALLAVVVLCFGALVVYSKDYYRADETAQEAVLAAEKQGSLLVFSPQEETDTALIFYPGGKVENTGYAPLLKECAEEGILCILLKAPFNLAILNPYEADGVQEQFPEIEHWYVGGHSLGGVCASMYVSKHTGEYEGLVLLGAYSSTDLSQSNLKVLQMYGSEDGVMSREKMEQDAGNLPADTIVQVIEGGNHSQFGSYGHQDGDGTASISPQEQWHQTAEAIAELTGLQEQ